ncbi:MAG: hypothetical protein K1X88_25990 [Nannocystaceae bacterium]|nr:hypothetical protein [Nannocystaceae bacterium]
MKSNTMLERLLTLSLVLGGCDLIDIGDGDDDDDSAGDSTGGDGGSDTDDNDDTHGNVSLPITTHGGGEDSGEGTEGPDSAEGGADSSGGVDPSAGTDGGEACEPDLQVCLDEATIAVCVEGEAVALDCNDVCIELGAVGSFGCAFDETSGVDLCWCDDGSGGGGA